MHAENVARWCLDVERVSRNCWELPYAAWVMDPSGFVVAFARGLTESRAVSAALFDLRINCSDVGMADTIDSLFLAFRAEQQRGGDQAQTLAS
jgi:hypothetical protein